jgi:hypothetical protein
MQGPESRAGVMGEPRLTACGTRRLWWWSTLYKTLLVLDGDLRNAGNPDFRSAHPLLFHPKFFHDRSALRCDVVPGESSAPDSG